MNRKLGVAGFQLFKDADNPETNAAKFERLTLDTKKRYPWVDLFFTGELYLQQYGFNDWKELAEPMPNAITERMARLADKAKCWLVPGSLLERDGKRIFNTSLAFNPEGKLVAKYRKMFPWGPVEDTSPGTEFVTFKIPDIATIGLTICYDIWFPELYRTLTWMGADVILNTSAAYTPYRQLALTITQAQAAMNQVHILNLNIIKPQGGGKSIFVDPEGRILQCADTHEEIMIHALDIDRVAWAREYGSYALSPVWKSLRDSPIKGRFPIYEHLENGEIFRGLGELKMKRSLRD